MRGHAELVQIGFLIEAHAFVECEAAAASGFIE
jgi:hypothetical protein